MIDKSFQALIISLVIHGLLTLFFLKAPQLERFVNPTEVDIVYDSGDRSQRVIIDNSNTPSDPVERLKEQAKNLSRINRRVKEEQVAKPSSTPHVQNLARFAPKPYEPPPPGQEGQAQAQEDVPNFTQPNFTQPGPGPGAKSLSGGGGGGDFSRSVAIGGGTQGEWIPGVKEGSFTALNTDQFTYYTFFARVKEAIRFRWVSGVRTYTQQASPEEILVLSRIPSSTKLEVTLSQAGDVLKVSTLKTSGSAELDDAAVRAFWSASPLHNPPVEMAEDDGLIRLYYSFQVVWQPHYMAGSNDSN